MERRLSAIMMTDMVGYSRLMEQDEAATLSRQKSHREDLFNPALAKHHGRIVKTTGDGLLAEFPSVVEAVACSVDVQREMAKREADRPKDIRIDYRIGIHLGDVFHENGDIHGDGVNIAARLEALAEPGGICLSGDAYNQLRNVEDVGFEDLNEVQVKNIARPIRAWRVLLDPELAGKRTRASKSRPNTFTLSAIAATITLALALGGVWWSQRADFTPADPDKMVFELPKDPSIAVMPFENLSDSTETDYLGRGLTETLISTLASSPILLVVTAESIPGKRGVSAAQETAEANSVRYVLSGTYQVQGESLRVSTQLVDALQGRLLWGETLDRALSSEALFEIQDAIAEQVAFNVDAELGSGSTLRSRYSDATTLESIRLGIEVVDAFQRWDRAGNARAKSIANEMLALNSNDSSAMTMAAWAHWQEVAMGWAEPDFSIAQGYAEKAIEADPENAGPHAVLAWISLSRQDFSATQDQVDLHIAKANGDVEVSVGLALLRLDRPQKAEVVFRDVLRRQPRFHDWTPRALGDALMRQGRYEEARFFYDAVLESDTQDVRLKPQTLVRLIVLSTLADRPDDVSVYADRLMTVVPGYSIQAETLGEFYSEINREWVDTFVKALRAAGIPE